MNTRNVSEKLNQAVEVQADSKKDAQSISQSDQQARETSKSIALQRDAIKLLSNPHLHGVVHEGVNHLHKVAKTRSLRHAAIAIPAIYLFTQGINNLNNANKDPKPEPVVERRNKKHGC